MTIAVRLRFAGYALILVAAIWEGVGAVGGGPSVRAQPNTLVATDLPTGAEERLAITQLLRQGVMRARPGGNFAPAEPTTLGEYLISLQQLFSLPQPQHPANFTDVPPNSPYYAAVQAMAPYLKREIMCFRCALSTNLYPEQSLTRLISIVPLVSILNVRGTLPLVDASRVDQLLDGVDDTKNLGPLARQHVATAISGGLISLSAAHRAELSQIETRANTAVMLNRIQTNFHIPEVRPAESGVNTH